ncbi:ribonuclease HI [Bdellovibrionota bacterium FG-2]
MNEAIKNEWESTRVFADGASSGNPGPGGWGVVIFGVDGKVLEKGGGHPATTNNRMELMATIEALRAIPRDQEVEICTDSAYVINGITGWCFGWRRNGWKTKEGADVLNRELWESLFALVQGRKITWTKVRGHAGIPGNERADEIAVSFSKGPRTTLYSGSRLGYDIIPELPDNPDLGSSSSKSSKQHAKQPAFSYLSLIGGSVVRHKTWVQCERRVKGQSGAKFKKALSLQNEREILRGWGFSSAAGVKDDQS